MVSTRSTKRRSRSPAAEADSDNRPAKVPRESRKPLQEPKQEPGQSSKTVKVVLLDIEGTICPITFVKETLVRAPYMRALESCAMRAMKKAFEFPYALKALPDVLATEWDDPTFTPYRDAFPETASSSPEALEAHVKDLTERDVKIAYLKNLQGYLWEDGYKSHAYSTPIYPDVLAALERWSKSIEIVIYSSGSIFAQKLLFQHIKDPASPDDPKAVLDRRDDIKAWFDTTNAGLKHDASSYEKIAKELERDPNEILFLSDNVKEVRAAIEAGMVSKVVDRPGNAALSDADKKELEVVESFEQLEL